MAVMNNYNLTKEQKELLRKLVELIRDGKLVEPIVPIFTAAGASIMLKEGGLPVSRNVAGDFQAYYEADLVSTRPTKGGTLVYSIKQAGYDAVDSNFAMPSKQAEVQYYIGAIIQTMSGGNLQAVGLANAEISQIVNDPVLLQSQVETLTSKLLETVKSELNGEVLIQYVQVVNELKQELLKEAPKETVFKKLANSLSFLGDIEGTISLAVRAWPYLYPLMLIAVERLKV